MIVVDDELNWRIHDDDCISRMTISIRAGEMVFHRISLHRDDCPRTVMICCSVLLQSIIHWNTVHGVELSIGCTDIADSCGTRLAGQLDDTASWIWHLDFCTLTAISDDADHWVVEKDLNSNDETRI